VDFVFALAALNDYVKVAPVIVAMIRNLINCVVLMERKGDGVQVGR